RQLALSDVRNDHSAAQRRMEHPMTRACSMNRARLAKSQRGVALFFALIAMVVLSLGAVALLRSVDTASSVAGNLAFRQATMAPVTDSVERAVDAIFSAVGAQKIPDLGAVDPPHLYHPSYRAASDAANGLPTHLRP